MTNKTDDGQYFQPVRSWEGERRWDGRIQTKDRLYETRKGNYVLRRDETTGPGFSVHRITEGLAQKWLRDNGFIADTPISDDDNIEI